MRCLKWAGSIEGICNNIYVMKKFLLVLLLFVSTKGNAQVTLERSYYNFHSNFYVTDLGNSDYKYVHVDSTGFTLYNLDHSFFLNVITPRPLFSGYQVAYITNSLFDCDTTNIEYV